MNYFAWAVITLFIFASIRSAVDGLWALSAFYILSALINLVVTFLK
jgi:hypothetical protein